MNAQKGSISVAIAILAASGVFAWTSFELASMAEARRAKAECERLQTRAMNFPKFWISPAQDSQCTHYGIDVPAPVK